MSTSRVLGQRATLRTACLVFLVATAGFPPVAAHAEDPPAFLLKWGTLGFGDGQFSDAFGLATTNSGFVYVADSRNNRIQKFTTDSVFVSKWGSGGAGPGQFNPASDVAVDPAGNVYVADPGNFRIQKFDGNGNFITMWPVSGTVGHIGVDRTGTYLYGTNVNIVRKYTTDGAFVTSWTYGPTVDAYLGGIGFGLDGSLYIASEGNHDVLKYAPDGTLLSVWQGSGGSGENDFDTPRDVAVDPDGNVFVVDRLYIRKFNPFGTLLVRFGFGGNGITTNVDGNIYVLLTGKYEVQKYGDAPTPVVPTTWGRIKALYRGR